MPSACRPCPGIKSAAEAANVVEKPEHDLGPAAEHGIVDHHSQMDRNYNEEQSE